MVGFRLFVFVLLAVASSCTAQTARVTFYSPANTLTQGLKHSVSPAGEIGFNGWLYDGDQKLAHASSGRFMTLRVATGEHTFTVPWKPDGPGKTELHLDIQEGAHYCVRLTAKYISPVLVPVMRLDSRIEQVACQAAFDESRTAKPLSEERVESAVRSKVENSDSFPHD